MSSNTQKNDLESIIREVKTIESGFEESRVEIQSINDLGIEIFFLCEEIESLLADLKENMERDLEKDVVSYYEL